MQLLMLHFNNILAYLPCSAIQSVLLLIERERFSCAWKKGDIWYISNFVMSGGILFKILILGINEMVFDISSEVLKVYSLFLIYNINIFVKLLKLNLMPMWFYIFVTYFWDIWALSSTRKHLLIILYLHRALNQVTQSANQHMHTFNFLFIKTYLKFLKTLLHVSVIRPSSGSL